MEAGTENKGELGSVRQGACGGGGGVVGGTFPAQGREQAKAQGQEDSAAAAGPRAQRDSSQTALCGLSYVTFSVLIGRQQLNTERFHIRNQMKPNLDCWVLLKNWYRIPA